MRRKVVSVYGNLNAMAGSGVGRLTCARDMKAIGLQPILVAWFLMMLGGAGWLLSYEKTSGPVVQSPLVWPESTLDRNVERPTLLMFAHPRCPCTRASVSELISLVRKTQTSAQVAFYVPADADASWRSTELVALANAAQNVCVSFDVDGVEAERFHVLTSGTCVLYSADGRLQFVGGITAGRGHAGVSESSEMLIARLSTLTTLRDATPSQPPIKTNCYGCALFSEIEATDTTDNR